uniref:Uncharacterized protein n=1 Tax=Ascaris lumbricoides TaxID=6252 RepID=A0A0M3IBE2_ASCLU
MQIQQLRINACRKAFSVRPIRRSGMAPSQEHGDVTELRLSQGTLVWYVRGVWIFRPQGMNERGQMQTVGILPFEP